VTVVIVHAVMSSIVVVSDVVEALSLSLMLCGVIRVPVIVNDSVVSDVVIDVVVVSNA